jgi:hypothetical protein
MHLKLTTSSKEALDARWHDQRLDLRGLKFDDNKRECVFYVLEKHEGGSAKAKGLLQKTSLQRCRVIVGNATSMRASEASGEVELYIEAVETSPSRLAIKCVNGTLEWLGQALEVTIETENLEGTEVSVALPFVEVSWRQKGRR